MRNGGEHVPRISDPPGPLHKNSSISSHCRNSFIKLLPTLDDHHSITDRTEPKCAFRDTFQDLNQPPEQSISLESQVSPRSIVFSVGAAWPISRRALRNLPVIATY